MHIHVDTTTKILIAVFIALVFIAFYCYDSGPVSPTRITVAQSVFIG